MEINRTKNKQMKSKKENKEDNYNSDITTEDLQAIGKKGLRKDSDDDKLLQDREKDVDFQGKDLDVPGRDNKTTNTPQRIKDEENNLYAQGGESNENLEAPERANTDKS